ncbi:MAG: dTMP kinase [Pseudomonadota bacterium]|nr:dTMP kinase [Pseudomonadota bacterium]
MTRGVFITLEGGEGGGKSTQARLLAEALRQRGVDVVTTREPGGSPGAEDLRKLLVTGQADRWDPLTEILLFLAARRDHWLRTIQPALERGQWVISDRFHDSTVAYQGYGFRFDLVLIEALRAIVLGNVQPDLTLVLDVPVESGLKRSMARKSDAVRHETMDLGFHERMRQGYLDIAKAEPQRCLVVDASRPAEAVHGEILAAVTGRFLQGRTA